MRVLLISHTCQSLSEGQCKAAKIASLLDGELLVLTPERWKHYGKWRYPEFPECARYRLISGKTFLPWGGPAQFYLHCYPQLPTLLKTFRPDIIDIWEEPWSLVSAQACWLRNRLLPKARLISETEQNIDRRYPPPFSWFRSYTLSQADFVIGRSSEAISVIRSQGCTLAVETVPNGVDTDLFRPMDRESCRRTFGLDGFVVGYIGRIVESKGLMDLINALPLCQESVTLVLAGSGEYIGELHTRVAELKMESRVRFISECQQQELPRLINAMDVLILPSHTTRTWKEQFGRVIIEAHACRTPVIGSNSGSIPEVVGNGGMIFPEHNPAKLAECVNGLAQSPERLHELGMLGHRQAMNRYTWDRVAERMLSIYEKVVRRNSNAP